MHILTLASSRPNAGESSSSREGDAATFPGTGSKRDRITLDLNQPKHYKLKSVSLWILNGREMPGDISHFTD